MLRILMVVFLGVVSTLNIYAQSPYRETFEKTFFDTKYPQKLPVLFRAYPVYGTENQFRVYLAVQIQYNFLQFVVKEGRYEASAEIEFRFQPEKGNASAEQIWKTTIAAPNFPATRDPQLTHTTLDSVTLPEGRYNIIVKYRDLNGERQLAFTQKLTISSEQNLFISPALFTEAADGNAGALSFLPEDLRPSPLIGHWHFNRPLGILLQGYQTAANNQQRIKTELIRTDDGVTLFAIDSTVAVRGSRFSLSLAIPETSLAEGKYRLRTVYFTENDSIRRVAPFDVIWFDKPASLWDTELALRPLQYITDEETFDKLNDGNETEKQNHLATFWKDRDPTPETPFNELMVEFYSRVDSSITRFSTRRKLGWNTDPGKIYIAMGPPTEVDDHSLDPIPNPYMRWIYKLEDKELIYTFRAVDGRKEYELTHSAERNL